MSNEHVLYRYFDENGDLLYIGISVDAYSRAKQHKDGSRWWPDAASVTFEKYPNRESVLAAERLAIKAEKPMHNKVHNSSNAEVAHVSRGTGSRNPLVGLYGFELVRDEVVGAEFPGAGFKVEGHIRKDEFLLQYFKVDHYGQMIVSGSGDRARPIEYSKHLQRIRSLKEPVFFDSFKQMLFEHRDWCKNFEWHSERYARRQEAIAERAFGPQPLYVNIGKTLEARRDAG